MEKKSEIKQLKMFFIDFRNLNAAKEKLVQLSNDKSMNKKKKKKKNAGKSGKIFSRKNHEPAPFPRNGAASKKKTEFAPKIETLSRKKQKSLEWKNRQKTRQKRKFESQNFIKI